MARRTTRRDKDDALRVICILREGLGWSFRRIANLRIGHSPTTISTCYDTAKHRIESHSLDILAKGEKRVRLVRMGTSEDLAWLNAGIHQNQCGGGKKIRESINRDEWEIEP